MRRVGIVLARKRSPLIRIQSLLHLVAEISAVSEITILEIERGAARKLLRVSKRRGELTRQATWQSTGNSLHQRPAQKVRHRIERRCDFHRHLSRITGEHFIATHPRE